MRMRNSHYRFLAASTLFAYALFLSGCGSSPAAESPPPEVSVVGVVTRPMRVVDDFNGRVEAIQSVDIRPRVSGYIDRVAYTEGAEVKAGDLLFVIDQRPYHDALMSARARMESARAAARLANSRYARAQALIKARAISKEEFDANEASRDQTAADLHAAEAAVATAELNIEFTEVRAPVAGRAGRAMLTRGNLVRADQSLLTTVVSQDAMYVYFDCDENSYLKYGGQSGSSHPVLHVELADENNFPREAQVDFLNNKLDSATGTIRARAVVPNGDRKLTPGMFARVRLESGPSAKALLIDEKAILADQDHRYVYVLGDGNKALRRDIVVGRRVDGLRVVQSGLKAQDRVIVGGLQKVYFSGMPVKPDDAVKAAKSDTAIAAAIAH